MAIKSVPKETVDYIPSYGGNRDDKPDEQMWVKIQPLTRAEADRYRNQITWNSEQRRGFRQDKIKTNIREVQQHQFLDNVLEIHHFLDYENGKEITEVKEFYDRAPDDLVEEIFDAMLNASQLGEDEVKNFDSQSGGSTPSPSPQKDKSGIAEIAEK